MDNNNNPQQEDATPTINITHNDLNKPLVITYCNKYKSEQFENTVRLTNTLHNNNWDYIVLGDGDKWKGFMTKITACKNYLQTLHPKKIIAIVDAHDLYCLRNSRSFIDNFKKCKSQMVVSMEHLAEGSIHYDKNKTYVQVTWLEKYFMYHNINYNHFSRKFVNAGLICGYAEDLIHYMQFLFDNNYTDDQKGLGDYMNTYPDKVFADINADLLHTCISMINAGLLSRSQAMDSPSLDELIGRKSFFLHIPGLHCSKGQKYLYDKVYEIFKIFNNNDIKQLYPQYNVDLFYEYNNVNDYK
jgi:hypothetical protein